MPRSKPARCPRLDRMGVRCRSTAGLWSRKRLFSDGVGPACRQAGKRLGAAKAHRQLEDLRRVQEFERGGLAADNVERERGACAAALPREQTAGDGSLIVMSKVMDLCHFGVVAQEIRREPRVSPSLTP
jgi:hypothetical protein